MWCPSSLTTLLCVHTHTHAHVHLTKEKLFSPGEIYFVVLLQEGGPLPGPETGLLSNTRK